MKIILASKSPRRKKLLNQLGLQFIVKPSLVDESSTEEDPIKLVKELALRKALNVAQKCAESLIIGSDTIVVHNNKILNKPGSKEEASVMLNNLSDTQHYVHTGVALIQTDINNEVVKSISFASCTKVFFSKLDQNEIDNYILSGSPMDKAGSYGIQDDYGAAFIHHIEGDFYNVVGLPINKLYHQLKVNFPEIIQQRNSIS